MKKVTNIQTNQGLIKENQSTILTNVDTSEDFNVELPSFSQKILIHTDRKMVIKMVNTILKNLGEKRTLDNKSSIERVIKTFNYINHNFCFNPYLLIDWDNCKNKHVLRKKNILFSYEDSYEEVFFSSLKRFSKHDCILELHSFSKNFFLWYEIIKYYPNSEWIVDKYEFDEDLMGYNCEGNIYQGTILMGNNNGNISIDKFTYEDLDYLEELYPVHFGYIRNKCILTDIEIDDWNLDEIGDLNENEFPVMTSMLYDEGVSVNSQLDFCLEICRKKKRLDVRERQLKGLTRSLQHQDMVTINTIDSFSPFYFDLIEERKVG